MHIMQTVETLQSILGYLDVKKYHEAQQLIAAALQEARQSEEAYRQHREAEERPTKRGYCRTLKLEEAFEQVPV